METVEEERALAEGDWAEIQFRGEIKPLAETVTEEGVTATTPAEAPITGEDVLIEIGGKNTLAAFNDALRGAKVGQELKFEVEYPAEFGEKKLAGQTVGYDVTVKAIKKKTYPERDAELAKQLGNSESWEEFEKQLRERVGRRKRESLEAGARNKMMDEVIARYSFPVPESLVQQRVDARLERGLRALAQQGMKAEDMRKLDFVQPARGAAGRGGARGEGIAGGGPDRGGRERRGERRGAERRGADAVDADARALRDAARAAGEGRRDGAAARGDAAGEDGPRALREAGELEYLSRREAVGRLDWDAMSSEAEQPYRLDGKVALVTGGAMGSARRVPGNCRAQGRKW